MRYFHLIVVFVAVALMADARASAQATASSTLELMQHLASMPSQSQADVFIGRLPDARIDVPMPAATLLGSIVIHYVPPAYGAPQTDIYYDGDQTSLEAYASALEKAGWTRKQTPYETSTHGGFQEPPKLLDQLYCRGKGQILVTFVPRTRDLRVTLFEGPLGNMMCGMNPPANQSEDPLPTLNAPQGEEMNISAGNPAVASDALFRGPKPISELMQIFSADFTQAGWTAGVGSQSRALASRSFEFIDGKNEHWQAVLTIYRVNGQQDAAIGFIDLTNLTRLSKAH